MNNKIGKFAEDEYEMSKYLILTNNKEVIRVSPERIVYIISDGNYSSMVLTDNDKHLFSFNLKTFEKLIQRQLHNGAQNLIRLGKKLIINGNYIYYINISKQQITLSDMSFSTKFTLRASKEALRTLKAAYEENVEKLMNID